MNTALTGWYPWQPTQLETTRKYQAILRDAQFPKATGLEETEAGIHKDSLNSGRQKKKKHPQRSAQKP